MTTPQEYRQQLSALGLDRMTIEASGSTGGAVMNLLGGRRAGGQWRASAKRQFAADRDRDLQPYESVKRTIDDLLQMDGAKIKIQEFLEEAKAG